MMSHFDPNHVFAAKGRAAISPDGLPSDEQLALYVDGKLLPHQRRLLEERALSCPHTYEVLKASVDALGVRREAATFRVVARLVEKGLELVNAFEHRLRRPEGELVPALGALRGGEGTELLTLQGPGRGLDELELQRHGDGTAHLTVRGSGGLPLEDGERASYVVEVDGQARVKRPYSASPLDVGPLDAGSVYDVKVVAKAPGSAPRTVVDASVDLR